MPALVLAVLASAACSSSSDGGANDGSTGGHDAAADASDAASGDDTSGDDDGTDATTDDAGPEPDAGHDASPTAKDGGSDARADETCAPFTAHGDTITDSASGLTWRRDLFYPEMYAAATTDCSTWGGRIPTQAEVQHVVTALTPCAGMINFPGPPQGQCVWSSTADTTNATFKECVYYGTPAIPAPQTDGNWVLCVR